MINLVRLQLLIFDILNFKILNEKTQYDVGWAIP
jgi:hypothetical protein